MPRFRVVEQRMYEVEYLIDADNADLARDLDGEIVEENPGDSWAYDMTSVEEVPDG